MAVSRHRLINPSDLVPARGLTHAAIVAEGRLVFVAGQLAMNREGIIVGATLAEQLDQALANVMIAVSAVGGNATDVVSLTIYTTLMSVYRAGGRGLVDSFRRHLGDHLPTVALIGVTELYEIDAVIEVVAIAVVASKAPR